MIIFLNIGHCSKPIGNTFLKCYEPIATDKFISFHCVGILLSSCNAKTLEMPKIIVLHISLMRGISNNTYFHHILRILTKNNSNQLGKV